MAQLSKVLRSVQDGGLMYWCQGCEEVHVIHHGNGRWTWNGDTEKPTFSPSVLVKSGHYAAGHKAGDDCWCTYNAKAAPNERTPYKCGVCHTFINNGMVQFLGDCTHQYAGQTLPLPDLPEHLRDDA